MSSVLERVHPQIIPNAWFLVAPMVEASLAHATGEYVVEDVFQQLLSGEWQLWVAVKENRVIGAAVTEVVEYARKRAVRIIIATVESIAILTEHAEEFESWALSIGATTIEAYWRPGFSRRAARGWGYEVRYHVAVKSLTKRMH